jgi:hypothetical protein
MGARFVDDEVYESYVLFAVRSILGDRRGRSITLQLKDEDAAAHEQVMIEAWRRHADLPYDLKRDTSKAIAGLTEKGDRLQMDMIARAESAGAFNGSSAPVSDDDGPD